MNSLDKIRENISKDIAYYIDKTLEEIREARDPVRSIDRKILFIKMMLTLKSLIKNNSIEKDVLQELHKSFNIASSGSNEEIEQDVVIYNSSLDILRRIYGKKKVSVSEILGKNSKTSDILDYIWLRKEGYLKKHRDGRLLVDPAIYSFRDREVFQRKVGVDDIIKYLAEIPSKLWPRVINNHMFEKLDNKKFVKLMHKFFGYNVRIDHEIIDEFERRISSGWKPSSSDWKIISKLMKKSQKTFTKYMGPYSLQWINPREVNDKLVDEIISDLKKMPLSDRWRIVSKINNIREYEKILERLDPITLSSIGKSSGYDKRLLNKILLGRSIANYVKYLLTLEKQYFEYSRYILSKVDPNYLDEELKPIYRSMVEGDHRSLLNNLGRKYWVETLEYIAVNAWDLIRTRGFDNDILLRALKLGYSILRYGIRGSDYKGDYKYSSVRGRLTVKKTVYNFVRGNYDIVKKYREKQLRIIAVVDISGSMFKYSLWAIVSLTSILPLVKNIVLFSDKVYVTKPPSSFSKPVIIKYLEKIFSEGFRGYTNISMAFREVGKIATGTDVVVVFSDLEQTVKDTDPWEEASRLLQGKCRRMIIFVPLDYRSDVGEYMKKAGAEIIVVENPSSIPRLLRRKLNLKIRVNIFPS